MQGEVSVTNDENEQPMAERSLRQRRGEESTEIVEVVTGRDAGVAGRRMTEFITEWALDDQGLPESSVRQVKVAHKVSIRRGESKIEVESRSRFDHRKSCSPSAWQRCYIAAHFPEDDQKESSASTDAEAGEHEEVTVWHGCVKELVNAASLVGSQITEQLNAGRVWKTVAEVEWESRAQLDPVTYLPFSIQRRGRVRKGNGISAISIELVHRVIGYFDMNIGSNMHRHNIDTDYETLRLGDPQSFCQLRHHCESRGWALDEH